MQEMYGYNVSWLIENKIILVEPWGDYSRARQHDMRKLDLEVTDYYDRSPESVIHLFSDLKGLKKAPSLTLLLELRGVRHPKAGWFISYPHYMPFFERLMSIAAKISGSKVHFSDSLENAFTFIQEKDPELDISHFIDSNHR